MANFKNSGETAGVVIEKNGYRLVAADNPQDRSSLRTSKRVVDDSIKFDNSDARLDDIVEKYADRFVLCNTEILTNT